MSLDILYRDAHLVVVNKPPGMLVHRSLIDKHETRFAMQLVRDQIGQHVYTVHRLDKPTSGLLVFALNPDVARLLTEQFGQPQLGKAYLAVVRGFVDDAGVVDRPLKEKLDKIADAKADADKPAQTACTQYEPAARFELPHAVGRYASARYSLIKLFPSTGRKHQLRRHMAHINHPILGDTTHGDGKHNKFAREVYGFQGLALTAISLRLSHPVSGQALAINAPLDARIEKLLASWGWQRADFRQLRSEIEQWQP